MTNTDNSCSIALSIAGSDSGGGAGIQADLKAMGWIGVHGTTAITSLTAQNSTGVRDIHPVPPDFLRNQIQAVVSDFDVRATKTGMLFSADLMEVVIEERDRLGTLVVDPVMVAESGDSLFDEGAESTLVEGLLPLADLVTPNVREATIIADHLRVEGEDLTSLGQAIASSLGGPAVLMKGGHTDEQDAVDYLVDPDGTIETFSAPRIETDHTHGSGCAYSSLIAGFMAKGSKRRDAVASAKKELTERIREGYAPGSGAGTLNFLRNETN